MGCDLLLNAPGVFMSFDTGEAGSALRVVLLGYGVGGRLFHAPILTSTPGLRLAAVVTRDPARRAQAAADLPDVALLDGIDDALSSGYDLAVVTTPNRTHAEVATRLVDAGVPTVVDKPLALSAAQALELVESAQRRGAFLTVYQNRRWDSDQLTLRRLIGAGALGDVLRYESRFERWRPEVAADKWRETDDPALGGGVLLDLGSHLVDQAFALWGPVTHVYAEVAARRGVAADDEVFLALTHASGVRSHISAGALVGAPGPRLRVLGSRGAYVVEHLDGQEDALRAGRRPGAGWGAEPPERWGRLVRGSEVTPVPSEPGGWPAFYAACARALRDGSPPPIDPYDGVRVLEILDAARESSARAGVVALPA